MDTPEIQRLRDYFDEGAAFSEIEDFFQPSLRKEAHSLWIKWLDEEFGMTEEEEYDLK